ncbi:hypothetical protein Golax_020895 [Gossypium laxum]|uniref:Uncharacterized protein n=1 Tax=Gossypium laxum TaxID=34288 RepID=A0A7J9AJC1_9ROSI|nr:hypothetical protein [Gossypium laxum]
MHFKTVLKFILLVQWKLGKQGEELKKMIGAVTYIECSSKTQQNVKAVFDAAIKVALRPPKPKRKPCKRRTCAFL